MDIAEKVLQAKTDFDDVYQAGRKLEYDRMWDVIQPEGTTNYVYKFSGTNFNFKNFYPKRDIRPIGNAAQLFYAWETNEHKGDFKARLEECGVVLDTSQATSLHMLFNYGRMDNIPVIDCTGLTTECTGVFANSWGAMTTIEKVIVKESITFSKWFDNAQGLINITFEGVIANDLDMKSCTKLSADSLKSLMECLSPTITGKTLTLPTTAQSNYEKVYGSGSWATLTATRSNWTIAYA